MSEIQRIIGLFFPFSRAVILTDVASEVKIPFYSVSIMVTFSSRFISLEAF